MCVIRHAHNPVRVLDEPSVPSGLNPFTRLPASHLGLIWNSSVRCQSINKSRKGLRKL